MKTFLRHALLPTLLPVAALTLSTAASADTLAFNASYVGVANVVEVLDPIGPVLSFQTISSGGGSFDLTRYLSNDVVNMATGSGTGTNRFIADNGDELYGSFSVQVTPTAVANVVHLVGQTDFTGGTGLFSGAVGSAVFTGSGIFTSATSAKSNLDFVGSISVVPEPGSWLLMSAGVMALIRHGRRRGRPQSNARLDSSAPPIASVADNASTIT